MPRKKLPDHLKKSKRMEICCRPADHDLIYEAIEANLAAGDDTATSFADYVLQAGVAKARRDLATEVNPDNLPD